ncbi:MAG: hypothetical protein V3V55_09165 [Rhodospirillales bacterium]
MSLGNQVDNARHPKALAEYFDIAMLDAFRQGRGHHPRPWSEFRAAVTAPILPTGSWPPEKACIAPWKRWEGSTVPPAVARGTWWALSTASLSISQWATRQGWGGRLVRRESARGILIAGLGLLAAHHGYQQPH